MARIEPYRADRMTTIAFAATTGERLWTTQTNSAGRAATFGADLAIDPDGSHVYVCGGVDGAAVVVALELETGAEAWRSAIASPRYASCVSADIHAGGEAIAIGGEWSDDSVAGTGQALMASIATADGAERWTRITGTPDGEDYAHEVATGPDGTVYGMVFIDRVDGYVSRLYALDPDDGSTDWTSSYAGPGPGDDYLTTIVPAPDGSAVYATGTSDDPGFERDMVTVAFDAETRAIGWEARLDPDSDDGDGLSLATSPDGSTIYTSGITRVDPDAAYAGVLATYAASDGTELGVVRSQSGQDSIPTDSVIDPAGTTVYVTGIGWRSTWTDVLTWAYPVPATAPTRAPMCTAIPRTCLPTRSTS
jgi:outer membrane protein assembly factor BamB